jgi:cyclin H
MFHQSTQSKNLFKSEAELIEHRNNNISEKHSLARTRNGPEIESLSLDEETLLVRYYEQRLRDFCQSFRAYNNGQKIEGLFVPRHVTYTALYYFKRVYLKNTVMDSHPRLMMLGCVWLSMKVEEFNVKIDEFCYNMYDSKEAALADEKRLMQEGDDILNMEYLIMEHLDYELVSHHPFRAIEGFLLELKTFADINKSPDQQPLEFNNLHKEAHKFVVRTFQSNLMLLIPPSQIAFAAIASTCKKMKKIEPRYNDVFGNYVKNYLFVNDRKRRTTLGMCKMVETVLKSVESIEEMKIDRVEFVKQKLENCRDPVFNPRTKEFSQAKKEKNNEHFDNEGESRSSAFGELQSGTMDDTIRTISDESDDEMRSRDHPNLLEF